MPRPSAAVLCFACCALAAGGAMAEWTLVVEQDFRAGARLDMGFWTHETGFQRNRERQYYQPANVVHADGALVFEARREQVPNAAYRGRPGGWRSAQATAQYTSGSIVSRGTLQYGRVEVVARTPSGAGMWPAIWLVHESPGQYGEIDMYEAVGKHPDTVFAGVHYGREALTRQHRNGSRVVPGFEGSWRTHTLEWTAERIRVLLDGQPLFAFDPAEAARGGGDPLRQPMRMHINLALGGTWGGPVDDARLPARFEIASLRIWRWTPGEGVQAPADMPAAATAPPVPAAAPAAAPPPHGAADPEPARVPRWGR